MGGVRLGVREDELGEPVDEELSEGEEAGELVRHAEPEGDLVLEGVDDVGEGLVHVVPEGVEVVETPLRAEMGLVAVGDGEELSALELLVLEDSATDGKKGVVEVVVVGLLVETDLCESGADLRVRGADQLEVVAGVHGELGGAGAGQGVVGENVLRAVDRREGGAGEVTVAGGARREAVVLDGGEEVREEVGAVRRRVEAGKGRRRRAIGGCVSEVGCPGGKRVGRGRGSVSGRDRAVKPGRTAIAEAGPGPAAGAAAANVGAAAAI